MPEGDCGGVVGKLVQLPGARELRHQLAREGEADTAPAPSVDDEELRHLVASLGAVEPHQGEAGPLAADLGPPCRAPLALAPVGVELPIGEHAVVGLRTGEPRHVVDVELQVAPEHVPLARRHLLDPDLRCHPVARRSRCRDGRSCSSIVCESGTYRRDLLADPSRRAKTRFGMMTDPDGQTFYVYARTPAFPHHVEAMLRMDGEGRNAGCVLRRSSC